MLIIAFFQREDINSEKQKFANITYKNANLKKKTLK